MTQWLGGLLVGLSVLGSAQAQQERVYWGVALGNPSVVPEPAPHYAQSQGWTGVHTSTDSSGASLKIYRGVVNDRHWATEVGVAFLGKTETLTQGRDQNNNRPRLYADRDSRAIYIDKLKYWGSSANFRVFARFGLALTETTVGAKIFGYGGRDDAFSVTETVVNPKFGIGVQYRANSTWHLRAEVEQYVGVGAPGDDRVDEIDIDVVWFGLTRLF